MSKSSNAAKVRRTLELQAVSVTELGVIKDHTPAKSDTAAIAEAIAFRAKLAEYDLGQIERALTFIEEVQRISETGAALVMRSKRGLLRIEPADDLVRNDQSLHRRPVGMIVAGL